MNTHRTLGLVVGLLALLLTATVVGAQPPSKPAKPADTPYVLVPSDVTTFSLVPLEYKLFWHSTTTCVPHIPQQPASPTDANGEEIRRIPSYGGLQRDLYNDTTSCGNPKILSNVVADADYVYFTTSGGLMRLSVYANPGDAPELINGVCGGKAELAVEQSNIFVMQFDNSNNGTIYQVAKGDGIQACNYVFGAGSNPSNLQTSDSFDLLFNERHFVYWLQGGDLHRFDFKNNTGPITLASGVAGYYAEGGRRYSCGFGFCFSDFVYYGAGTSAYYYDNVGGSAHGPIYTSSDSTAVVFSLTTDDNYLFLFEHRDGGCSPFTCYAYALMRMGHGGASPGSIYAISEPGVLGPHHLTTDGSFLFWQDDQTGAIRRLANDASLLPQTNMEVTGFEVTQGVQYLNNSVQLIQNRRTFVRMYVKSDGPDVPWVGAQLEATWNGGSSFLPLLPINPSPGGTHLTVPASPNRDDINQSFVFELPLEWTTHTNLTLTGELNPGKVPLQADGYVNDTVSVGPFNFQASPRVEVNLVQFSYTMTGTLFTTPVTDTNNAVSLVRRLWPIASTPGNYNYSSPGFRPRLWDLYDAGLGSRMNFTASECNAYLQTVNNKVVDKRNLCASAYADNRLIAYRSEQGLPNDSFMYGLIPSGGGFTVRGQAFSSDHVSSGDSANAGTAAHEITHTAGRSHPFKGSSLDDNKCGNTPQDGSMDNNYPYADSSIGPGDGSLEGFESGDPALKIVPAVMPSKNWFDIIGYCGPRWISDYTYNAIYSFFPHILAPSPLAQAFRLTPDTTNDWLSAYGIISADGQHGWFDYLRRLSSVASVPTFGAGAFSLRLLDAHGAILADHSFAPDVMHHGGGAMEFGLEVPFAAGTAQIELIKSPNQVITSYAVSAHAPTISNVALQSPPNPVNGTVTLHWTASDLDGDPLTFDVLYSSTATTTFQPLLFGVVGSQTSIDTSHLGGGTAHFRVIASDGLLTAQADSPNYTMANKPPIPHIDSPGNGNNFSYGQLVALLGEADDPQGVGINPNNLVWTDQRGDVLGTGTAVYTSGLPVGTDVITLTATNNLAMSAATHITVTVGDDFKPAGPLLSVGPSAVNWQVAPGTIASQKEDVGIANVGGGSLSWTAHSDQGWLTLSALSGSAPFTITLTANPAGMTDGQLRTAHVTITKPADGGPEQDVIIPVQLAMGDVEGAPFRVTVLDKHIYLPVLRR